MIHRRTAIETVMTGMQPSMRAQLATARDAFAAAAGQVDEHAASASSWGT
jgi:hypothetical protein